MEPSLKPSDLRDFVSRRWDFFEREKLRFLAERYRRGGPAAARSAALRLWQRFTTLYPAGQNAERRAADLAFHVALKRKLEQAGNALGRR